MQWLGDSARIPLISSRLGSIPEQSVLFSPSLIDSFIWNESSFKLKENLKSETVGTIRSLPTLISKREWFWYELPLNIFKIFIKVHFFICAMNLQVWNIEPNSTQSFQSSNALETWSIEIPILWLVISVSLSRLWHLCVKH